MKESALRGMFVTHYLNLQRLASDTQIRKTCQNYPMLGTIISPPVYRWTDCRQSSGDGTWMLPWKTKLVCPEENQSKLARSQAQALLYCPNPSEISNEIDWFEKDMAADSLTHQLLSTLEEGRRWAIIRQNCLKDPFPIWEKSKKTWLSAPTEESNPNQQQGVAENPANVDEADFVPQKEDSLALAYESVMRSVRMRCCRHRAPLLQIYKRNLEEALFEDVPWNAREQQCFLQEWKDNFFSTVQSAKPKKSGRWTQCEGIDDIIASQFIEYFVSKFIADPKNKKLGEIACVLWILLWIAQEGDGDPLTIKAVLQLSSQDIIADDAAIIVNGREITISWGLRNLLLCLRGEGEGKRACRLFKSLDLSGKALERAMIHAHDPCFRRASSRKS